MKTLTVILLLVLAPVTASAVETLDSPESWCRHHPLLLRTPSCAAPGICATPICEGEVAPFSGQLLTPPAAALVTAHLEGMRRRVEEAREVEVKLREIEVGMLKVENIAQQATIDALLVRVNSSENPPIYERVEVVVPIAVAVAATVGYLLGRE